MMTSTPRFLLLQARLPGDEMAAHERGCFADALGVDLETVVPWDLTSGTPTEAALESSDALLVGGSGQFSVLDNDPFIIAFIDVLADTVVERQVPTFASCFGFQGLVVAGGGVVVEDKDNTEVGTFDIQLTTEGATDPLLKSLAPQFRAQLGHKDRADRLPAGMVHLARSDRAPIQALRVAGTPIFATQFHPELTKEANIARYLRYWDEYGDGDPADDPILKSMQDTPEASALLPRWVSEELMPLLKGAQ
ncbi:MAG: gamma-glutamyl-gamma-aminobutyrate hydrolase family protein [Myxococcota bacterium]|nr:gamma-glutamyl-gamma-aminobutyrate hydrolase family protein [Myxococcota bacterium]